MRQAINEEREPCGNITSQAGHNGQEHKLVTSHFPRLCYYLHSGQEHLCSVMQRCIYQVIDSLFLGVCDVPVTQLVTTSTSLFIKYVPHKQSCIGVCDVTPKFLPTVTSLKTHHATNPVRSNPCMAHAHAGQKECPVRISNQESLDLLRAYPVISPNK